MLAASGGCSLSQDRISYYTFEEMLTSKEAVETVHTLDPIGDLSHKGVYISTLEHVCDWIYNHSHLDNRSVTVVNNPQVFDDGDRSDRDSIREFIDDGRPVIRSLKRGHATLVTGYAIVKNVNKVESYWLCVLDPWTAYPNRWRTLADETPRHPVFTFPPSVGKPVREDEREIYIDSDGDKLFDFDETQRFGTDPNDPDTDDDKIPDYEDVLGYVFDSNGSYRLINPDIDGDAKWKESDKDNDHADENGIIDGCEDANRNGFFDYGGKETDNFVAIDDGHVVNPECFAGFIRVDYKNSLTPDSWELILLDGGSMSSPDYVHSFRYYYYHELITRGIAAIPNPQAKAEYKGEGQAMARLERDAEGRYTLSIDIRPHMIAAETHLSIGGRSLTQNIDYPLTMTNWKIGPDILGDPIRTPDGGLKLQGFWDLFAGFDIKSGTYPNGYVPNKMSGFHPLALVGGKASAIVSWEIWIEPPSWENESSYTAYHKIP
jgi:hypothetical protein